MDKINFKKGFTLIELLVVIAIIGILASVVLASLNTARNRGRDASVQSSMSSARAQAELGVDSSGTYLNNLCGTSGSTPGGINTLTSAATSAGGINLTCGQNTASGTRPSAWAAAIQLPSSVGGTASFFCVDSTGYAGIVGSSATIVGGFSSTDVVCG